MQEVLFDLGIIDGLKKAEESGLFMMKIDIVPVDDGCYTPLDYAILDRYIGDDLSMEQKGISRGKVKFIFLEQRRNPVGISPIYTPWKMEKGLQIFFSLDLLDGDYI